MSFLPKTLAAILILTFIVITSGNALSSVTITLDYDLVFYQPEQIHLSVNGDGSAVTVTWSTWNETESIVEFGTLPTHFNETRGGYARLFVDGGREKRRQYIHRVQLEGLKPDTYYCKTKYRAFR